MLLELRQTKFRVVGTGEVIKVVKAGSARKVFVAKDAAQTVIEPLLKLCKQKKIEVSQVRSMVELGEACGIHVGAASAALLREGRKKTR